MKCTAKFNIRDSSLHYTPYERQDLFGYGVEMDKEPLYILFKDTMEFLKGMGFFVKPGKYDRRCSRTGSIHYANYDLLLFDAEVNNVGIRIAFYQEGKPFHHLSALPYLYQLVVKKTLLQLADYFRFIGATDITEYPTSNPYDLIKLRYAMDWNHPQENTNFDLFTDPGVVNEEIPFYNERDLNGKPIKNGDWKYFYSHNGHLFRGQVFHNINNMWWVVVGNSSLLNMATFELFDCDDISTIPRKKAPNRTPLKYKTMRAELAKMSTKELERELRRRKKNAIVTAKERNETT